MKPNQPIEQAGNQYPDAELEKERLELFKKMIHVAQSLLETKDQLPCIERRVVSPVTMEQKQTENLATEPIKPQGVDLHQENVKGKIIPDTENEQAESVPEVYAEWPAHLWEQVRDAKQGSDTYVSAPIEELDMDQPQVHWDSKSWFGEIGSVPTEINEDKTLAELPSFMGEYEARSEIKKLPSIRGNLTKHRDSQNLASILLTPIQCTLTLGELLKVRPQMWEDLEETMEKFGIKKMTKREVNQMRGINEKKPLMEPVPLNQVGDYCEGKEGNITLLVQFNEVKALAILDSGAGVAIATKKI